MTRQPEPAETDASRRITTDWTEVIHNLWIGDMRRPYRDEFDHAVAISPAPPPTDDGLRHLHILPIGNPQRILDGAVAWIVPRWHAERRILIQSEPPPWAQTVAAATLMHLGASADEAISSLRAARADALHPQYFPDLLRAREVRNG